LFRPFQDVLRRDVSVFLGKSTRLLRLNVQIESSNTQDLVHPLDFIVTDPPLEIERLA